MFKLRKEKKFNFTSYDEKICTINTYLSISILYIHTYVSGAYNVYNKAVSYDDRKSMARESIFNLLSSKLICLC